MSEAGTLIEYEDTVLHQAWKAAGGGSTLFGQVVTSAEAAGKTKYVELANPWLTKTASVLSRKAGSPLEIVILSGLYTKILGRRDELVEKGYGRISESGEDLVSKVAKKVKASMEPPSEWPKVVLALGAAIFLAVLLGRRA